MAESDEPLLQGDVITEFNRNHATARFADAALINDVWFVSFDVANMEPSRTIAFRRNQSGEHSIMGGAWLYGPRCAVVRAVFSGVRSMLP